MLGLGLEKVGDTSGQAATNFRGLLVLLLLIELVHDVRWQKQENEPSPPSAPR